MKILHLSTYDGIGGAAKAAIRLHHALREEGHDSWVLVQSRECPDHTVLSLDGKINKLLSCLRPYLDALPLKLHKGDPKRPFSLGWLPDGLNSKIEMIEPDVVHLHYLGKGFLRIESLIRIKRPIIWTLHDSWPFTGGCHIPLDCTNYHANCGACLLLQSSLTRHISAKCWQRKRKVYDRVKMAVVAPSSWMADCARGSSLLKEVPIEVIPHGIDPCRFQPIDKAVARKIFGFPSQKKILLFGACDALTDRNKGFGFLEAALREMSKTKWRDEMEIGIFGNESRQDMPDTGFPTHYLGFVRDETSLAVLYSSADVMVVPSIQEAFGQTAMESLACGTPVVAFRTSGLMDIVGHKVTGYLAEPFEVSDLKRGILWVVEDEDRWRRISRQSRERVEKSFTSKIQAEKYARLYRGVMTEWGRGVRRHGPNVPGLDS